MKCDHLEYCAHCKERFRSREASLLREIAEGLASKDWPLDYLPPNGSASAYEAALKSLLKGGGE
jgi:hypothetical protein